MGKGRILPVWPTKSLACSPTPESRRGLAWFLGIWGLDFARFVCTSANLPGPRPNYASSRGLGHVMCAIHTAGNWSGWDRLNPMKPQEGSLVICWGCLSRTDQHWTIAWNLGRKTNTHPTPVITSQHPPCRQQVTCFFHLRILSSYRLDGVQLFFVFPSHGKNVHRHVW